MPHVTDLDTDELIADTDQYAQSPGLAAILTELKDRVIKQGDADDSPQHTKGLRPKHAPILP